MPALTLLLLLAAGADATVTVSVFDAAGHAVAADVALGDHHASAPAAFAVAQGRIPLAIDGVFVGDVDVVSAVVDVVVTVGGGAASVDVVAADPAAVEVPASVDVNETGRVRLRVRSLVDGSAIDGARVDVKGRGFVGSSDDDGFVEFGVAGAVTVSVVAAGCAPAVVEVNAGAGEVGVVDVALLPLADELDELTVSAPHIGGGAAQAVSERRAEKAVVEVMGREQMQKAGDSDAAAALKRVTGLTVVGGRYVYVRGLGDRYSATLVNGGALPSPEPERRVVPLDLFPSSLLESMTVQKTWSPELPGEFGGGSVQLKTRGGSDDFFATASVGASLQPGATFTTRSAGRGGALTLLGFDDGARALPADIQAASDDAPLAEGNALTGGGLDKATLERLGEEIGPGWTPSQHLLLPGVSFGGAAGGSFDSGFGKVAVIASVNAARDARATDAHRALTAASGDDVVVVDELDISEVEETTNWGGVLGLAWQPNERHKLRATTFINRDASDEARIATGFDDEIGADVRLTRLRFVARQLVVQQLGGEHVLPWAPLSDDVTLQWRASYALALRDEPGLRSTRYDAIGDDADDGAFVLSDRSEGNQLMWSSLRDHAVDAATSLRLPFVLFDRDGSFDVGIAGSLKVRAVDTRRFKFLAAGPRAGDLALRARDADDIFTAKNISPDGFMIGEATRATDNHSGDASVGGAFVKGDVPVTDDLVVSGGVRVEASRLSVTTFELFRPAAPPVVALLQNLDVLPELGAAWSLLDDVSIKTAWARTVVRPELRELSPALYSDVAGARARFGNPDLEETIIWHGDVRAEWALSPQDGLSLALFGKRFEKPIESVVTAGADQAVTANNVDGAFNVGVEVEGRVSLATFGAPKVAPVVDGLWFGGNAALIASQVIIGEAQRGTLTSSERPLEGQSPWVLNLQVGSDDDDIGFGAAVLYNVAGPRIVEVGALSLPDTFEQPVHQLDVVLRQRLPLGLSLSLKAQNLLDLAAERTQGDVVVEHLLRGRSLSVALSFTL